MNEEKFTSGRGGKREGAGRPKGTVGAYKEKIKKPCSFKLSEGEEQTTRTVLADMRHEDIFDYEQYVRLTNTFKPLILRFKEKYNNALQVSFFDSSIMVRVDKTLKEQASQIIDKIINWAKETLDEEYFLPLPSPIGIWSLESKEDIKYSWFLERKPKENKEDAKIERSDILLNLSQEEESAVNELLKKMRNK